MCRHYLTNRQGETFAYGYDYRLEEWYYQTMDANGNVVADEQPAETHDLIDRMVHLAVFDLLRPTTIVALILNTPCCPDHHNNVTHESVVPPEEETK